MSTDISKHHLVPKHTKLSDSEKENFYQKNKLSPMQLPKIIVDDPTVEQIKAKVGDVIKIERISHTAGISYYYRVVIDG